MSYIDTSYGWEYPEDGPPKGEKFVFIILVIMFFAVLILGGRYIKKNHQKREVKHEVVSVVKS